MLTLFFPCLLASLSLNLFRGLFGYVVIRPDVATESWYAVEVVELGVAVLKMPLPPAGT